MMSVANSTLDEKCWHTVSEVNRRKWIKMYDGLCCAVSTGQSYRQIEPQYWTVDNVLEWISDHVESNKFDAHSLSLALCSMDGYSLCQMAQDQMIEAFGPQLGSHLYQSLQEHKTNHGKPSPYFMIFLGEKNGSRFLLPQYNTMKKKYDNVNGLTLCSAQINHFFLTQVNNVSRPHFTHLSLCRSAELPGVRTKWDMPDLGQLARQLSVIKHDYNSSW